MAIKIISTIESGKDIKIKLELGKCEIFKIESCRHQIRIPANPY